MKVKALVLILLSMLGLITGCFVPRNYVLTIAADSEGISVEYDGGLIVDDVFFHKSSYEEQEKRKLMRDVERSLEDLAYKWNGTYAGSSRLDGFIDFKIHGQRSYSELLKEPDGGFFYVKYVGNGAFVIKTSEFNEKTIKAYVGNGVDPKELSGVISFRVGSGVKVLSHNADSIPGFMSQTYKWEIEHAKKESLFLKIEIEHIKQAEIARKQREQEQRAAELKRKQEKKWQDFLAYVDKMEIYYKKVFESQKRAETAWNNFQIVDSGCSFRTEQSRFASSPPNCILDLNFTVRNGNSFPLRVDADKYLIVIKDERGVTVDEGYLLFKEARQFDPGQSIQISKSQKLYTISKDAALIDKVMSGGCIVSIYPSGLKITGDENRGEIKPDGSPFVPRQPKAPGESEINPFRSDPNEIAVCKKNAERMLRQRGVVIPAKPTESTFVRPTKWFKPKVVQ